MAIDDLDIDFHAQIWFFFDSIFAIIREGVVVTLTHSVVACFLGHYLIAIQNTTLISGTPLASVHTETRFLHCE